MSVAPKRPPVVHSANTRSAAIRRRGGLAEGLVVAAVATLLLAGCAGQQLVTEYGAQARRDFVDACTSEQPMKAGRTAGERVERGTRSDCTCVYEQISKARGPNHIEFDKLREYEDRVADAKAGSVPEPPTALIDAITACTAAGPAPATTATPPTSPTTSTG